jgi:hypothetical protein
MTDFSQYKLGARFHDDKRTIRFSDIIPKLPAYPSAYDVDSQYPNLVDARQFANGPDSPSYGDCVKAGRAHATFRYEYKEQGIQIPILDSEVINDYFQETGGGDDGLDMINSLNDWRKGWTIGGKLYNIYAYAQTSASANQNMAAIYFLNGLYIGLNMPISAQTQDTWDITSGPNSQPGSWGGHCVYVKAYDIKTLTCITWGMPKQMTWNFFTYYCNQPFAIVQNRCTPNSPIDQTALDAILAEITGEPVPNPSPTPTPPSTGTLKLVINPYNAVIAINGRVVPGLPTSLTLAPGNYTVQASLKGYKTQQQNTIVFPNTTTLVTINLVKSRLCIFN